MSFLEDEEDRAIGEWEPDESAHRPWELSLPSPLLPSADDEWARLLKLHVTKPVRARDWYIECVIRGNELLKEALDINKDRRGGVPVLKGTGFTASQALAEIADHGSLREVAEDFDLDVENLRQLLNGLALVLNKPFPG